MNILKTIARIASQIEPYSSLREADENQHPLTIKSATHHDAQIKSKRCINCGDKILKYVTGYTVSSTEMAHGTHSVSSCGGKINCGKCKPIDKSNWCVHGIKLSHPCHFCPDGERYKNVGEKKRNT